MFDKYITRKKNVNNFVNYFTNYLFGEIMARRKSFELMASTGRTSFKGSAIKYPDKNLRQDDNTNKPRML